MAAGLQCWDASGNLIVDATTLVGESLASFSTNGQASGSITNPLLIGRDLVHFVIDTGDSDTHGGPNITFNPVTGTVSWQYSYSTSGAGTAPPIPNDVVYYGGC